MASVRFTPVLKRFFPSLRTEEMDVDSVGDLLDKIEEKYPGISNYILDENGNLRKHVKVYIGEEPVKNSHPGLEKLKSDDKVLISQAISGG